MLPLKIISANIPTWPPPTSRDERILITTGMNNGKLRNPVGSR